MYRGVGAKQECEHITFYTLGNRDVIFLYTFSLIVPLVL